MHSHPYFPSSLELEGYVAPTWSAPALLITMGSAMGLLLSITYLTFSRKQHSRGHLSASDVTAAMWFVLCGAMHSGFELYYLVHFRSLASTQDILGNMWKEYAKSDSRYLSQSSMVLSLETVTVTVIGPLCWGAAYGIWSRRLATRYLCQLAASVLHLYSVLLYYGTEFLSPEPNCRPEALYFFGYFVLANLPWLLVPLYLAITSIFKICDSMRVARQVTCGAV
ncbi:hypothetical protein H4R20_002320 [Coemansia guatemalensis]|uniref:EXPERA domain-containing protein n=1 Tax=Coemansia guatemalensis TaxID=2761395 RepID=A0A9W8HVD2_9FUNG|nr:hypothetical protein H4R20_002320 [Coemansia guatemalensis]